MATTLTTPPGTTVPRPVGAPSCADTPRVDSIEMPGAFAYEHTDIPEGITIADYRRQRAHRHARRHRHRLRRQAQQTTD
jgi:hypothetical protein